MQVVVGLRTHEVIDPATYKEEQLILPRVTLL